MKAVICAAGKGSRLAPLTNVAPKCLLPVYNQPMIMYPLSVVKQAGITDVCIVVSAEHSHLFATLLADGSDLGLNITFKIQKESLGVCDAIARTEDFVAGDDFCVILGDNVMFDDLSHAVNNFKGGANLLLTEVENPRPFGVAKFEDDKLIQLVEKPQNPPSNLVWIGCAMFDSKFFEYAKDIELSPRGEYETNDVIQKYIDNNQASFTRLEYKWFDAGTYESLMQASNFVKDMSNSLAYQRHQNPLSRISSLRSFIKVSK